MAMSQTPSISAEWGLAMQVYVDARRLNWLRFINVPGFSNM